MLHATNDQAPARPQHKKRDADAFAADIRARQAAPPPSNKLGWVHGDNPATDDQIIARAQEAAERLIAGAAMERLASHSARRYRSAAPTQCTRRALTNRKAADTRHVSVAGWRTRSSTRSLTRARAPDCSIYSIISTHVEIWRQLLPTNRRLEINHPEYRLASLAAVEDRSRSKQSAKAFAFRTAQTKPHRIPGGSRPPKEANGGNLFTSEDEREGCCAHPA